MRTVQQINAEVCAFLGLTDTASISAVTVHLSAAAFPRVEVTRRLTHVEQPRKVSWRTTTFDLVPHDSARPPQA